MDKLIQAHATAVRGNKLLRWSETGDDSIAFGVAKEMAEEGAIVPLNAMGSCRHQFYSEIGAGRFSGFDLVCTDKRLPDGRVLYQIVEK